VSVIVLPFFFATCCKTCTHKNPIQTGKYGVRSIVRCWERDKQDTHGERLLIATLGEKVLGRLLEVEDEVTADEHEERDRPTIHVNV
jgi:hypothetical protein